MELRLFQVDAFTCRLFHGNPAAVVPLDAWLADDVLQAIAMENNLAETAFFIPAKGHAPDADYHLRWFTPAVEMDLCGHATLAAAHVLIDHLGFANDRVRFASQSGVLKVLRAGDRLVLDFPSRAGKRITPPPDMVAALGCTPQETFLARDLMAVLENEAQLRDLAPDFELMKRLDAFAVIATAPGEKVDFVSRFFAPKAGIPEDPVTGSAHCTLVPYWAKRLGRNELHGTQISSRVGDLFCTDAGERVLIGGNCVTYLEGTIRV